MKGFTSNEYRQKGLSTEEAVRHQALYGLNILPEVKREPMWKLYLEKYRDPIIVILIIAALVSLGLAFYNGDFIETIGILLAIFFATTVGFFFERDAAKKFALLTQLDEQQPVKVRRDGKVVLVPRQEVTMGDVVLIEVGDEIPADGKLLLAVNLQVNESTLTGENLTSKSVEAKETGQAYASDRVLRSTMVMNGRGEFVVTAIGARTEIGKVARHSTEVLHTKTPLDRQLAQLARRISIFGGLTAAGAFATFLTHNILTNPTLWQSDNYLGMAEVVLKYFMMAVTLIVMAVPEGLPMAITLALALNMRRMLGSNILVRKLHACETIGAVNMICTDKTGTLTQNAMQVVEMHRQAMPGWSEREQEELLYTAISVNSTAETNGKDHIGNPTEGALLEWLADRKEDYKPRRMAATIYNQESFSTEKKYMSTTATTPLGTFLLVKGAPEVVVEMCDLPASEQEELAGRLHAAQQKGYRTLAFATKRLEEIPDAGTPIPLRHLTLQAFCAIADPIRDDVKQAIDTCRKAGIEIKIVTGDSTQTATEVAKQLGFWNGHAMTGMEWNQLSDEEAAAKAREICLLSRARPQDKQRLVRLLQEQDYTVAVTGDGTNDAPALHHAHVGLSLGAGTHVAKEASDITILDDSFLSISKAVMWGRSLYKNIQRFLYFQLVVNITALLLTLGGAFIGNELPLTVTQILWVNLIMDTFAAMALSSLPPSREVMKEQPRKVTDPIVTRPMAKQILCWSLPIFAAMFGMLIYCERNGEEGFDKWELTVFFTTFVMLHFWNLLNAKTLGTTLSAFHRWWADRGLHLIMLLILVGQILIVECGGAVFRTTPLKWQEWTAVIAGTSSVLWLNEVIQFVRRRKNHSSK